MLSAPLTNYVQVDTDDLCLQRKLLKQAPIFSLLDQYLAPEQKGKRNGKILLHYISVFLKIVRAEADLQKTQGRFQRTLKSFFSTPVNCSDSTGKTGGFSLHMQG